MTYNNKKVIVSVLYCSPSQNNNEFELLLSNFEQLLNDVNKSKPFLSVIKGGYNARFSSWRANDVNATKGSKLYSFTSPDGFPQLINEPTHIQTNSSSFIDLIFTDQPNLLVNTGVHASLHPNRHYQIVHSSFNLNICYSPPYQCQIWDYKMADSTNIRKALGSVNLAKFFDHKDINAQVSVINEIILNAFPQLRAY